MGTGVGPGHSLLLFLPPFPPPCSTLLQRGDSAPGFPHPLCGGWPPLPCSVNGQLPAAAGALASHPPPALPCAVGCAVRLRERWSTSWRLPLAEGGAVADQNGGVVDVSAFIAMNSQAPYWVGELVPQSHWAGHRLWSPSGWKRALETGVPATW